MWLWSPPSMTARSTFVTSVASARTTATAWRRSWSPTPRRTGCTRRASATCATWSTATAARSTSTAPTSTPCSAWHSPVASAATLAPQPAQDLLHPPRRRRSRCRTGRGGRAPRAVPAVASMHPRPSAAHGIGPVSEAPLAAWASCPISWAYIRLLSGPGLAHATKSAVLAANYVAARLAAVVPDPLHGYARAGRPRVHPRSACPDQGDRRHRRRRGEAADRLRLPRSDRELPGGRARSWWSRRRARTWPSSIASVRR